MTTVLLGTGLAWLLKRQANDAANVRPAIVTSRAGRRAHSAATCAKNSATVRGDANAVIPPAAVSQTRTSIGSSRFAKASHNSVSDPCRPGTPTAGAALPSME